MTIAYQNYGKKLHNKYHDMMVRILSDLGHRVVGTSWRELRRRDARVVVFNWFFPATGSLIRVFFVPLVKVALMVLLGKRIVFVHHNTIAHDSVHPAATRLLQSLCYGAAATIVAHNRSDKLGLARRHGSKVLYVPHPHYIDQYGPEKVQRLSDGPVRLGFVGAVRPYKNIEILVQALRSCPRENLQLHIYGRAVDSAYADELRRLIGTDPRVHFSEGFVSDEDLATLLGSLDVLVLPYSLRSASNSGAAILAASYGVPFIISGIPGMADWPLSDDYLYDYQCDEDHVAALSRRLEAVVAVSKEDLRKEGARLKEYCRKELDHKLTEAGFARVLTHAGR